MQHRLVLTRITAYVVDDNEGLQEKDADIAGCGVCQEMGILTDETWKVFQVVGQKHFHLQCTTCGTSYCPNGECP